MKRILLITLFISVGFCQQEWNMKFMEEYDGLMFSPTSDKPYTGSVFSLDSFGTKKEEGKYRNGLKNGRWTNWYKNGQKEFEENYKDGERDGLQTNWYENGNKKEEGTYKDGNLNGLWTEWSESGEIKEELTSSNGKLVATNNDPVNADEVLIEDSTGRLIKRKNQAVYNGAAYFLHRNGKKKEAGGIKNGFETGKWDA